MAKKNFLICFIADTYRILGPKDRSVDPLGNFEESSDILL